MKLIQNYLTKSGCYKTGRKITVKGLMIHSVGCPQPKASAFISNWDRTDASACVHAIVEPGGNVYQTLPWNHRGWHCGGDGNNTHIGVEMTEPGSIRYTGGASWEETGDGAETKAHVQATYATAVELFAKLCQEYGLNPLEDGVIVSHSEGAKRGIASNHADVEHLWSRFGLTMDAFRRAVKEAMQSPEPGADRLYRVQVGAFRKRENAQALLEQLKADGYSAYIKESGAQGQTFLIGRLLRRGDMGADVAAVQAALIAQGYPCGLPGADGDFGAATEAAVMQCQTAHGLTAVSYTHLE